MRTRHATFPSPATLRRTALIQLLLLIVIQLAPAIELSCDNIAFAFGPDRLLSGSSAGDSATVYSREGMPEISGLRSADDGGGVSGALHAITAPGLLPAVFHAAFIGDASFPHRRNDILHVSPKHSPPFRS